MELPNTKIRSVLPVTPQSGNPTGLIQAWSGGTVDTTRSRLLVWGGGHMDYAGDEMYALDLATLSIKRIVEPSPVSSQASCTSALPDGKPAARHTYDGLTYAAHVDKFYATAGSLSTCGAGDPATWTYDFTANKWSMAMAKSPMQTYYGTMAAYDPATKLVYIKDQEGFYSYAVETNIYKKLGSDFADYHLSAAIDTKRRKFVMLGNGVQVIDMVNYSMKTMATTKAPSLVTGAGSPGVAYDPVADRIVAWSGGGNVYALNMDTGAWSQVATSPGPTAAAPVQGTFGRWGYVPQYNVFALINDIDQNAWVFRLAK